MASSTKHVNITDLPVIDSVAGDDKLIVQRGSDTSTVNFSNFVVGTENVSFYSEIAGVRDTNNTLLTNSLSTVSTLEQLSAFYPGADGSDQIIYVTEREVGDGMDTGGFFKYDSTETYWDNGGTIINPAGNSGAGRWRRINYDKINIKWFGAKSGSIYDSTDAIQQAIMYAQTVGGNRHTCLLVPEGTFYVTNLTAASFLKMEGNGHNCQIALASTSTDNLFTLDTVINTDISDIRFTGNTSVSSNVFHIKNCQDVNINNCEINYGGDNGIMFEGSYYCNISNNKIKSNAGIGLQVIDSTTQSSAYNLFNNNRFISNTVLDINEHYGAHGIAVGANSFVGNIADTWADGRYGIPDMSLNSNGLSVAGLSGSCGTLIIRDSHNSNQIILDFQNGLVVNSILSGADAGVFDFNAHTATGGINFTYEDFTNHSHSHTYVGAPIGQVGHTSTTNPS
jgi:hypothetical protein